MLTSCRRRAGTLAASAALAAFAGGCGDEGGTPAADVTQADAVQSPAEAASAPPTTPAERGGQTVEQVHGEALALWKTHFREEWAAEPNITWTAEEQSVALWTVTAEISDGRRVRERASWSVNLPLDPDVSPEDLTANELGDEVVAGPLDAAARRLSKAPPAIATPAP